MMPLRMWAWMFGWVGVICGTGWGADRFEFAPSKIRPNDGYELRIGWPDGTLLDYELRYTSLDHRAHRAASGPWGEYMVQGGKVVVPGGQNFPTGLYFMRVKPRGAAEDAFTLFDLLMVDTEPRVNPGLGVTDQVIGTPPAGSTVIFENRDGAGQFAGYSSFVVETDGCSLGGYTLRQFKTREAGYWNAGGPSYLRWCVSWLDTVDGRYRLSPGGMIYKSHGTIAAYADAHINVSYEGNGFDEGRSQAMLGGWPVGEREQTDVYMRDSDMGVHYSLLPAGDRVPGGLSDRPITVVEMAFGHSSAAGHNDAYMDQWHSEALAPNMPDAALRMRYVESGMVIHPDHVQKRWSVTEDWVFQLNGLITRSTHWVWTPPACWRGEYRCVSEAELKVDATAIDIWVPDDNPLRLGLKRDPQGRASRPVLSIGTGQSYTLTARRGDGQPYHGYLELRMADGRTGLWRDAEAKPIYVSNGQVNVPAKAYGALGRFRARFEARPYLANSSINAVRPVGDDALIPNAGNADWSNPAMLTLQTSAADADLDGDVDGVDLRRWAGCFGGSGVQALRAECATMDLDGDRDVDEVDFVRWQQCYRDDGALADPDCAN